MGKRKILLAVILLISFVTLAWRSSGAEDAGDASSALCEYGIQLYRQGQVADAIHELKKSLIINPHNLKAKNYLMKIYSERDLPIEPQWEPRKKIKAGEYENRIKELREEVRNYQKELRALNAQNRAKEAALEKLNLQLQSQKELFARKEQDLLLAHKNRKDIIARLEDELSRLKKETLDYQKQFNVMNDLYTSKQGDLERLTRQLQEHKDGREKISTLKEQIERLQKETADYQKQLTGLKSQYLGKETALGRLTDQLQSQKELLSKKEKELLEARREQKSKAKELEKQIAIFEKQNLGYQNRLESLRKRHLAELASKNEELAKLKADYESRLKKMAADLKAKDTLDNLLIEDCSTPWMQDGEWQIEEFKDGLAKLECEFDEDFISGASSWEKLDRQLQVLMPNLESDPEFAQLETQASKDADMPSMLTDSDN